MKMAYRYRINIAVFVSLLFTACLLAGCGAVNSADGGDIAVTAAEATTQTAASAAETPAATEPETVELIEDAVVDADFIKTAHSGADGRPPVAKVAGLDVTQPEYIFMMNKFKSGHMLNTGITAGADEDVNFWIKTNSSGKTRLDEAREAVLSEMHKLKACQLIAEERGISLGHEEIENISTDFMAQEYRFGGRDEFEKVLLEDYGITLEDYWRISELLALRQMLFDSEMESITVAEEDARDYFDKNPEIFGDLVKIRQILFFHEGDGVKNQRTEEESKKLAEEALESIEAGSDAATLARAVSEEPNASTTGGEHIITRGDQYEPEEVLIWAFGAQPGDSTLIETAYGYYVVYLDDKLIRSFEDFKDDILSSLRDSRLAENVAVWMSDPAYALVVNEEIISGLKI